MKSAIIFLNFVPKIPSFFGKLGPETSSAFFRMKLGIKGYSEVLIPNSSIIFLSYVPKIPLQGKFRPKLQSALFKMKLSTKGYSRLLILSSRIVFLKFRSYNAFFLGDSVSKPQSALFRMKLSTKEHSGVLILNSKIAFSNSVPFLVNLVQKLQISTIIF